MSTARAVTRVVGLAVVVGAVAWLMRGEQVDPELAAAARAAKAEAEPAATSDQGAGRRRDGRQGVVATGLSAKLRQGVGAVGDGVIADPAAPLRRAVSAVDTAGVEVEESALRCMPQPCVLGFTATGADADVRAEALEAVVSGLELRWSDETHQLGALWVTPVGRSTDGAAAWNRGAQVHVDAFFAAP